MATPAPAAAGGGNILTRKFGPLPTWGWLGTLTAGIGAYALFARKKKGGSSSSSTSTVPIGQVPDYVFQNYNELPAAASTPTAPVPPTGTPGKPKPPHGGDDDDGHGRRVNPGGPQRPQRTGTIGAGDVSQAPDLREYTSNGRQSLEDIAKAHGTTTGAIQVATTRGKRNVSRDLANYFKKGNFDAPLPRGVRILYLPGVSGQKAATAAMSKGVSGAGG